MNNTDKHESNSKFMWKRETPSNVTEETGLFPDVDHTTNTSQGFYMLAGMQGSGQYFDPARMSSPLIGSSGYACKIQFWYYLLSPEDNMKLLTKVGDNETVLADMKGAADVQWRFASIGVGHKELYKVNLTFAM